MTRLLENHCAIITGASQGLGLAIARSYLAAGASLMICARDARQLDQAFRALKALVASAGHPSARQAVIALPADVSQPRDVAALVDQTLAEFGRLDVLVNSAAVAGPIGPIEAVDWQQWVRTIEINLIGAALLSHAVLPHFKRVRRGKLIHLSGGGATQPLPMLSAYAASKAGLVRLVETLAEEARPYRIEVNAIAPGVLNTRMLDELLAAGPERIGRGFHEHLLRQKQEGGVPLAKAAELAVFLGSARSDGITGKLISAVWDPWEALPDHLQDLAASDVYTLRRIVPADRALDWGEVD